MCSLVERVCRRLAAGTWPRRPPKQTPASPFTQKAQQRLLASQSCCCSRNAEALSVGLGPIILTLYLRFEQQVIFGHLPDGVKVRAKAPGVPHSGLLT